MYGCGNCGGKRPVALALGRPQAVSLLFKGAGQTTAPLFQGIQTVPTWCSQGKEKAIESKGHERAQGKETAVLKIEKEQRRVAVEGREETRASIEGSDQAAHTGQATKEQVKKWVKTHTAGKSKATGNTKASQI